MKKSKNAFAPFDKMEVMRIITRDDDNGQMVYRLYFNSNNDMDKVFKIEEKLTR
jgi:hypothetical protein